MMFMVVVTNAPPRLRGRLAAWLVEARAGVYVGNYSNEVRGMVWGQVLLGLGQEGDAVMIWPVDNDQGYEFRTAGRNRRMPVEFDGLKLVSFYPE